MTTSPVMTVTDELLAELDRGVRAVWRDDDATVIAVDALTAELRRLRAENAELAEIAAQANVNCKNTAYYLRKYRPDLADICSGWCVAIDTAMATQ